MINDTVHVFCLLSKLIELTKNFVILPFSAMVEFQSSWFGSFGFFWVPECVCPEGEHECGNCMYGK